MTFYVWLTHNKERDDHIGDFARDVQADPTFPQQAKTLGAMLEHLAVKLASPAAVSALHAAYAEWKHSA